MAILFLDFFGSDPSKMDQTHKFGERTSRILEFKPERLDFQCYINMINKGNSVFLFRNYVNTLCGYSYWDRKDTRMNA